MDTTLTIPMSFAFGHVCVTIGSSTGVLLAVTNTEVASEAAVTTMFTSAFVVFIASIETRLRLYGTTFLDYGHMPRIFSSMKLVQGRMLTASFSMMWNVASVK